MIRTLLREEIKKSVKNLYQKEVAISHPAESDAIARSREAGFRDFDVALATDDKFGDYASNIAMVFGDGSPLETAKKIKEELEKSDGFQELVLKTEIAGPGFINFYIKDEALIGELKGAGKKLPKKSEKINLEFISANPTGKLHIGHGRGAFYGDALANVLEHAGYNVEREYYINDARASAQIKELGKTALGEGDTYLTDYVGQKIKNKKNEIEKLKNGENVYGEAGYLMAEEIQKDNRGFMGHDLGISFDRWFSEETEIYGKRMIERVLAALNHKKLVYEKDGAKWLKTSEFGDDEDRVVIRSDGSYSYFLADIAYHQDKIDRGYEKIIDVWGADHQGHVKRLLAVAKMLNWRCAPDIKISQMVTIKEGGETKKLSKRAGNVILLEDLLAEVGLDAMRWFYLSKSLSTHMEFDVELAKKESKDNPVYYVQYAHARTASILRKVGLLKKIKAKLGCSTFKLGGDEKEKEATRALVKKIIQFDEVVEDSACDYQIHRITTYAYELAQEFTKFYENARVLGSGEYESSRLYLVARARKTLKEALKLLGVSAPDKM